MKKVLLPLLLTTCLMGANPKLYSGLGNTIYDGIPKLSELADVQAVAKERNNIEAFLDKCRSTKSTGFALDKGAKEKAETQAYLERLRVLNREYEFYVHMAETALEESVRKNDYKNFAALIGTGLIDIENNSDMILGFYNRHGKTPAIEEVDAYIAYLEEVKAMEAQARAKRRAQYEAYKKRRIQQISDRQEAKKEAHREAIDAETQRIKEEVKRKQEEELRVQKY